jgi:aromatic ring hydroxylase
MEICICKPLIWEHEFTGPPVEFFASYHRQSYACKDLKSPEVGKWLEKCFKARSGVPTEHRMRVLRLIENLMLGTAAVGYLTESMHGAGSPQAQRIMISRLVDTKGKQQNAKRLCSITRETTTE